MEYGIERVLNHLGALDGPTGKAAMFQVDRRWWDSSKRLPAAEVVIRRNMELESPIRPWLAPGVEACRGQDAPHPLPKADAAEFGAGSDRPDG